MLKRFHNKFICTKPQSNQWLLSETSMFENLWAPLTCTAIAITFCSKTYRLQDNIIFSSVIRCSITFNNLWCSSNVILHRVSCWKVETKGCVLCISSSYWRCELREHGWKELSVVAGTRKTFNSLNAVNVVIQWLCHALHTRPSHVRYEPPRLKSFSRSGAVTFDFCHLSKQWSETKPYRKQIKKIVLSSVCR